MINKKLIYLFFLILPLLISFLIIILEILPISALNALISSSIFFVLAASAALARATSASIAALLAFSAAVARTTSASIAALLSATPCALTSSAAFARAISSANFASKLLIIRYYLNILFEDFQKRLQQIFSHKPHKTRDYLVLLVKQALS